MDAETIADEARSSIGWYCMSTCKALCCRKGIIRLQGKQEIAAVTQGKEEELRKERLLEDAGGEAAILHVGKRPCPSLTSDSKCSIYTNPHRPKGCANFPLYFYGNTLWAASFCPAVKTGLMDEHLKRIEELGVKVLK
ncbi:YkgJ family cysteine cluster protein [Candidatus Woesearchaeota archaeon]|nr:YkgJ family cysteine cluster protein [Candidatus Woesearchaeota archaeon]